MKKRVFVIWAKGDSLVSHFLSQAIGAERLISFKTGKDGKSIPAILRYPFQARNTYQKLKETSPEIIWVQNPPIFAVLTVWIYAKLNGGRFIIDTHTAGFLDQKWRFFFPVHKFLAKRALLNTVHNYKNLGILDSWKIKNSKVLQFYTPQKEEILDAEIILDEKINSALGKYSQNVFMVNRFASDDAYLEVIEAAKLMPEVGFFITGNDKKVSLGTLPDNVFLTGFLDHQKFIRLMNECDVVLALTKRKDTVLWSVREALTLQKPMVLSDTEALRHYFSDFGIFTNHLPLDLKEKIKKAMDGQEAIRLQEKIFIEKDRSRWSKDLAEIENIMEAAEN